MEGTSQRSGTHIQSFFRNEAGKNIMVRTSKVLSNKDYSELEMRLEGPESCHSWIVSTEEAKEVNRQLAQMIRYTKESGKKTTKKKAPNGSEDEA